MPRRKQRTADLGQSIRATATELLEGGVNLTARSVAAAANTSTAALYELFGDKSGLLRAVFFDGFATLERILDSVVDTGEARTDLVAALAATRRFALDHPMLFELMFSRPFAEFRPGPDELVAATGIRRAVMRRVDHAIEAGLLVGNRTDMAQALIAANRGLIASELAGILGSSAATTKRRWHLTIDAVIDGLHRNG